MEVLAFVLNFVTFLLFEMRRNLQHLFALRCLFQMLSISSFLEVDRAIVLKSLL